MPTVFDGLCQRCLDASNRMVTWRQSQTAANQTAKQTLANKAKAAARRATRKAREDAYRSCGMVKGNLGGWV